jgi:segregation and condensation protein A
MGVVVHLNQFSGPMALLLHLIRSEEMNIFDININEITKQYLDSIRAMKKLNLEIAGDFIAMAATLIQIKSSMLLPNYNEEGEVIEGDDPRKDLVRRLLEYQQYQEAGQKLYQRNLLGRNVWPRGASEEIKAEESEILLDEGNALFALISSYRKAMSNVKKAVHRVAQSLQSIADRIWEMRSRLVVGKSTKMSELLDNSAADQKGQVLITFLSLLELAKIGLIGLFQSENFEDIHIETKREIDRDAISHVEDYESVNKFESAEQLETSDQPDPVEQSEQLSEQLNEEFVYE